MFPLHFLLSYLLATPCITHSCFAKPAGYKQQKQTKNSYLAHAFSIGPTFRQTYVNCSFSTGTVPSCWLNALVTPVPKVPAPVCLSV